MQAPTDGNVNSTSSPTINPSIGHAFPYFIPLLAFPCLILASVYGGEWIALPLTYLLVTGFWDRFFGNDKRNLDARYTPESKLFLYSAALFIWAVAWMITLVVVLYEIFVSGHLALWESVLIAIALVCVGRLTYVAGHELIHRRSLWERRLGEFLFASVSYPHYSVEHLYIHHAKVGTPADSGSAPKGLSFWSYLPRELKDGLIGVYRVIRDNLAIRRRSFLHYTNPFWRFAIQLAVWYAIVFYLGGWWALLLYLVLCFCSLVYAKVINYVQHYGLRRVHLPNGRYERVGPQHSWSSSYRLTDKTSFNIQRHADHHSVVTRHFAMLQHFDDDKSPALPSHYLRLAGTTLFPKKWFAWLDPIVDAWRSKNHPDIEDWRPYDSKVTMALPDAFQIIEEIYAKSPRAAEWMEDSHSLIRSLESNEFKNLDLPAGFGPDDEFEKIARKGLAVVYWLYEMTVEEMKLQLDEYPRQNAAEAIDVARQWINEKVFQVGIHVMRESLSVSESQIVLTNVADAAISFVLDNIVLDFGKPAYGSAVVLTFGELGKREVVPGIQLELTYLYDNDSAALSRKIGARFIRLIRRLSRNNLLFAEVPKNSELVNMHSLAEFEAFHTPNETPEELLRLTSSHVIDSSGSQGFVSRVKILIHQTLMNSYAGHALVERLSQPQNINGDSEPLTDEALKHASDNLENFTRKLLIENAREFVNLDATDSVAIIERAQNVQLLDPANSDALLKSAKLWRDFRGIRSLLLPSDDKLEDAPENVKETLARACGQEDFQALHKALQSDMTDSFDRIQTLSSSASA